MFAGLTGWHLLIILAVILLLFGATRLPALAKSVGQSTRIFKKEMREAEDEKKQAEAKAKTEDAAEDVSGTQSKQ